MSQRDTGDSGYPFFGRTRLIVCRKQTRVREARKTDLAISVLRYKTAGISEDKALSDHPEGTVADVGEAVQRKINAAGEAQDQLVEFIREYPISATLIAVGIGYVLGKIT
jgi:ribosome-binding protein aMBF1 (putative translation factor)